MDDHIEVNQNDYKKNIMSTLGLNSGYTVKYSPWPLGNPTVFAQGYIPLNRDIVFPLLSADFYALDYSFTKFLLSFVKTNI